MPRLKKSFVNMMAYLLIQLVYYHTSLLSIYRVIVFVFEVSRSQSTFSGYRREIAGDSST